MTLFEEIIHEYKGEINMPSGKAWDMMLALSPMFIHLEQHDKDKYWETLKDIHEEVKGKHYNKCYAMYEVMNMHHTKINGDICKGEILSVGLAEQIHDKYRRHLKPDVTKWDVYVAINAQYHDYELLLGQWFGADHEVIKEKVIEGAITFWFKDEDYPDGTKVWDYFN